MATKKLSEALAELQKAASVSGLDVRLVVAGQSSTDNAQTITLQQAKDKMGIPIEQTDWHGYEGKYIYSHQSDANRSVLSGNMKAIINNQKKVELQYRIWGATDYTSASTKYVVIPTVTTNQQGSMDNYVYARLLNHTLTEGTSTTNAVIINYTNFAASGNKTLTISAASSAKAGVMTSVHYNQLTDLSNYQRGSLGTFTTTDAFKAAIANMPTTHKGKYGHYYAILNGTYLFVTFVVLEESNNTYSLWVEGPVIKSEVDGDIYLNNELGVHIIGRIYSNGAWGLWRSTVLDDELPIPASTTNDGLMTKEDKQLLEKIKTQLNL